MKKVIAIKYIPNVLTFLRIIACIPLLLLRPLSFKFFICYGMCGLTDILDGYLARKLGVSGQFGAKLDSGADFVFAVSLAIIFFKPLSQLPLWIIAWIGGIMLIRFSALAIGYFKYHTFYFLHTYGNKLTGLVLFLSLFLYRSQGIEAIIVFDCIFAGVSAIEEFAINITSKELNRDVKGLFLH